MLCESVEARRDWLFLLERNEKNKTKQDSRVKQLLILQQSAEESELSYSTKQFFRGFDS